MKNTVQHAEAFFDTLQHKLTAHRQALRHVDQYLSTGFNALDYAHINEQLISTILCDLLDPDGPHGQGSTFLDLFLARASIPELIGVRPKRVETEWRTSYLASARRIDIVIEYVSQAVGIENKPWAREQDNQVSDYQRNLALQFGDRYHLMFLTSDGREPQDCLDAERLRLFSYRSDIPAWLEECEQRCQSDKFRWFLRDFNTRIQKEFPRTPESEKQNEPE